MSSETVERRRRAEQVRRRVVQLWGDDLPQGEDPLLTLVVDALAADDEFGSAEGVVVRRDALGYDALTGLLAGPAGAAADDLPRPLLSRAFRVPAPAQDRVDLPGTPSWGMWEFDVPTEVLAWDEQCAAILGRSAGPTRAALADELEHWLHPGDRDAVATAFARCAATGQRFQLRFRLLVPGAGYAWCTTSGRLITASATEAGRPHLVGVLGAAGVGLP